MFFVLFSGTNSSLFTRYREKLMIFEVTLNITTGVLHVYVRIDDALSIHSQQDVEIAGVVTMCSK